MLTLKIFLFFLAYTCNQYYHKRDPVCRNPGKSFMTSSVCNSPLGSINIDHATSQSERTITVIIAYVEN